MEGVVVVEMEFIYLNSFVLMECFKYIWKWGGCTASPHVLATQLQPLPRAVLPYPYPQVILKHIPDSISFHTSDTSVCIYKR